MPDSVTDYEYYDGPIPALYDAGIGSRGEYQIGVRRDANGDVIEKIYSDGSRRDANDALLTLGGKPEPVSVVDSVVESLSDLANKAGAAIDKATKAGPLVMGLAIVG